MFANNSELMAFGKTGWHITEIIKDTSTGDQTIYMGKCAASGGSTSSPSWCIKKITITNSGSTQTIVEKYAGGKAEYGSIWDNRASLTYSYLI